MQEHGIIPGQTDWKVIDQLPIGSKLQTTTYSDGLARQVQTVSRETATPADPSNPATLWGDMVQYNAYDVFGRQPKGYLPYTTTNQSGKYKTTTTTDQPGYYSTFYSETFAYSNITFESDPFNRADNIKSPGTLWAAGTGVSESTKLNDGADDVKIFAIGYSGGDIPSVTGVYPANSLMRKKTTDANGKLMIEYFNSQGQQLLRKVQLNNLITDPYTGWICTYTVYDDFGYVRYAEAYRSG